MKQLGKYEIIRLLGQGAMGEVYLAFHPAIGREVAVKTILPSAAKGEEAEERFRREAAAAGKLNHPNLVTIYDFDRDGDLLYLVMEYVQGEDLEALIAQQAMTPAQFLETLAQVCDGLSHAHRNGVIHRDIKPSNVRVIRDGKRIQAKVMDFGIARTHDSSMTATGIVMGTVSYMAPEYIQTGRTSVQGDLWAVGVMLYECLAGRKPFGGDNTTTVLFKIVSEVPAPLDPGAYQGISPSVRDILDRALSKDPAQRYQTAEELAKALRACKDPSWKGVVEATAVLPFAPEPTVALPTGRNTAAPTAQVPPDPGAPTALSVSGGRGIRRAALGTAVAVLLGVGGYLVFRKREAAVAPPPPPVESGTPSPPVTAPVEAPVTPPPAPTPGKAPAAAPPQTPPKAEQPSPQPPVVEETLDQRLERAVAQIATDPAAAAAQLRDLSAAHPGDARVQGNLLAVCYRTREVAEFERSLDAAVAAGLSGPQMMRAAPAFRQAMVEELRAHKARDGSHVLPVGTIAKLGR